MRPPPPRRPSAPAETADRLSPDQVAQLVLTERLDADARRPVALALSGGGDSVALLRAAAPWAAARGRPLVALTVDHGLHPDSQVWTAFAGRAADQAGALWRGLSWTGPKPAAGLPAAARGARHRLLADAARSFGASVLLLAHTADDVAEGDWMRANGAPTLGRLSPWSPSPAWPEGRGLFILRPFLSQSRSALRTWLAGHGDAWLEDPSNQDLRFGRPRARAALASRPPAPAQTHGSDSAASTRVAAARFQVSAEGIFRVSRADWAADPAVAGQILAIAVACASGAQSPVRGRTLMRLESRCRAGAAFAATAGGARIQSDGSLVVVGREPGELSRAPPPPLVLEAGEHAVWDGRFDIQATQRVELAPLRGRAARLPLADRARLAAIAPAARGALPALTIDGTTTLPEPWGCGPALARPLVGPRFLAACGLMAHEREIAKDHMANSRQSSYVDVLALA